MKNPFSFLFTLPDPGVLHEFAREQERRELVQVLFEAKESLSRARLEEEDAELTLAKAKARSQLSARRVARLLKEYNL